MIRDLNKLNDSIFNKYIEIKEKSEEENRKDWRNAGVVSLLFTACVLLCISSIFLKIAGDSIPMNTKVIGNLILYVFGLVGGICICFSQKIRFYKVDEIVNNFNDFYKSKFYKNQLDAISEAKNRIKNKKDLIKELQAEYKIQSKIPKDIGKYIKCLEKKISEKEENLEIATYQYFLSRTFNNARCKRNAVIDILNKCFGTYIICFVLLVMPCITTNQKENNSLYVTIFLLLAVVSAIFISIAYIWSNKQDFLAFKKLNIYGLSEKPQDYETINLHNELNEIQKVYSDFLEEIYLLFENVKEEP